MKLNKWTLAAAFSATALAFVACGDDSSSNSSSKKETAVNFGTIDSKDDLGKCNSKTEEKLVFVKKDAFYLCNDGEWQALPDSLNKWNLSLLDDKSVKDECDNGAVGVTEDYEFYLCNKKGEWKEVDVKEIIGSDDEEDDDDEKKNEDDEEEVKSSSSKAKSSSSTAKSSASKDEDDEDDEEEVKSSSSKAKSSSSTAKSSASKDEDEEKSSSSTAKSSSSTAKSSSSTAKSSSSTAKSSSSTAKSSSSTAKSSSSTAKSSSSTAKSSSSNGEEAKSSASEPPVESSSAMEPPPESSSAMEPPAEVNMTASRTKIFAKGDSMSTTITVTGVDGNCTFRYNDGVVSGSPYYTVLTEDNVSAGCGLGYCEIETSNCIVEYGYVADKSANIQDTTISEKIYLIQGSQKIDSVSISLYGTNYGRPSAFSFLDNYVTWNKFVTTTETQGSFASSALRIISSALEKEGFVIGVSETISTNTIKSLTKEETSVLGTTTYTVTIKTSTRSTNGIISVKGEFFPKKKI